MEKLDFIQQFRAFIRASAGVLNAREQAVYVRLLGIWNELRRPEWFEVAKSQLMRELCINSKVTIIAIRKSLEKKGFIKSRDPGYRRKMLYHIVSLYQVNEGTKNAPSKDCEGTKNGLLNGMGTKDVPLGYKKCTIAGAKNEPYPENTENTKNIAAAASPDFAEIANFFSNNIHPIVGEVEMQKLASFLDDYGKDWTLAAIEEAAESNGRSVKYIGSILERWKRDGFKSDRKGKRYGQSIPGGARPSAAEKMRAEQAKWDAQTSGWE